MSTSTLTWQADSSLWRAPAVLLRPLHLGLTFPSIIYITAMTVFLFRPPDLFSFYADRIIFGVLIFFVFLRTLALRDHLPFVAPLSLPMLGLTVLAMLRALREPFDAQQWSLIASKYIVPFTLFHVAILVFRGPSQRKHFALFATLSLAYLGFIAIAFLFDARSLIFPRFILDESLGFHPDRARGPFLQAVANGVSLNILGIIVITLKQKRHLLVSFVWVSLLFAIVATMTRAVWISFAASSVLLALFLAKNPWRILCALLAVTGLLLGLALGVSDHSLQLALGQRTSERGPVEARLAVYDAGWTMFRERPLTGWSANGMYAELGRRMTGYHLRSFYVHNTYLALLVEFGLPGLILYGLLFLNLFRLSWRAAPNESVAVASLRKVWPIILAAYLFNAFFVDMAYQFVIGLLFTVSGMLCAREESAA
jgi:putative inorganic carbon (HCO3(-)) transporter